MGILAALRDAPSEPQLQYISHFVAITTTILDFEQLKTIYKASTRGNRQYAKGTAGIYEPYNLVESLFSFAQRLLLDTLDLCTAEGAISRASWETISNGKHQSRIHDPELQGAIKSLYHLCWRSYLRQAISVAKEESLEVLGKLPPVALVRFRCFFCLSR